ncbi:MAG: hypothetical protein OHK0048_15500 [Rhodoferax sp.]
MNPVWVAHGARLLQLLPTPVLALDADGWVLAANPAAQRLYGLDASAIEGQHLLSLGALEDDGQDVAAVSWPDLASDAAQVQFELWRRSASGRRFKAVVTLLRWSSDAGQTGGLLAQVQPLHVEALSFDQQRLLSRIVENSEQGILITDASERIVSVNAAFTRITGYSAQEALGQTPDLLRSGVHDADFRARVRSAMKGDGPWQGEIVGKRKNGELFPQSVSISVVRNEQGAITHAFSLFSDISVLHEAQQRMQRLANFDALTGLPNRQHFHQLVEVALAAARRRGGFSAVLALNVRRFNAVNDTFGHDFGDAVLREISQRLRGALRDEDVLARVGADEFVVALLSVQQREHAGIVAQKLLAALKAPICLNGTEVHVSANIGVALYPQDGADTASLLHSADIAVKRLKGADDAGILFFSPDMNQRAKARWQLEGELRHAITQNELMLYYQPKISLRSGCIVGAEALLRWAHPVRGMVSPAEFVPVAEETGLILELGQWVLEQACRQIHDWLQAGFEPPVIAVNLSARQFDRELPQRIQAVMQRFDLSSRRLQLELTESLLVRGAESVIDIMNQLVSLGLVLSMDDFGTGYSGLSYLKKFPITTLKIDRSFVLGIPGDANDCAIAQAIVTMAQQLRQEIVAEGVETRAQMHFLRRLGCDQLQGYLFSKPLPAAEFAALVRSGARMDLDAP